MNKTADGPEVAELFQDGLFSKHGIPIRIVSDRDPKFASHYWTCLAEITNVRVNISTADHPRLMGSRRT